MRLLSNREPRWYYLVGKVSACSVVDKTRTEKGNPLMVERMAPAGSTGCHPIDDLYNSIPADHLVTWQHPTTARSIGGGS